MADALGAGRRAAASTRSRSRASSACSRETPAEDLAKHFLAAGARRQRRRARAARRASPRASPRRKPASSSFRAKRALGAIAPADFSVARDNYGAPRVVCSAAGAGACSAGIASRRSRVSLTHDRDERVGGRAGASRATVEVPLAGRLLYRLLPLRRARRPRESAPRVRRRRPGGRDRAARAGALRAPAGSSSANSSASAGCRPSARRRWCASRTSRRSSPRCERGKGVLILTGHFGNWEVATIAGIAQLSGGARPLPLRAPRDQAALARRARHAAVRQGGLRRASASAARSTAILERLEPATSSCSRSISTPAPPDGIDVEFFGHPAWTFKSLAIIALATGAPVLPASSWREPTAATCCASSEPLPLIEARTRTRRSGATRAPTTRRSSAWSCAIPSSGTGCTGAGRSRRRPRSSGVPSAL